VLSRQALVWVVEENTPAGQLKADSAGVRIRISPSGLRRGWLAADLFAGSLGHVFP